MTFGDFFINQAKERREALALRIPQRHWGRLRYEDWTFDQLLILENQIYHFLKNNQVASGERVMLAIPLGALSIAALFALLRLGALPLLIDPGQSLAHMKLILAQGKPDVLLTTPKGWAASVLFANFFPKKINRILLTEKVLGKLNTSFSREATEASSASSALAILYTSGSTGAPKGVIYTYEMLLDQLNALKEDYHLEPGSIDYPILPIFALFNPLLGVTTVLPEVKARAPIQSSMSKVWEGIETARPTQSFASPIFWKKLTQYADGKGLKNETFRKIFMAGCSIPEDLLPKIQKIFPNATLQAPYGATEALPLTDAPGNLLYAQMKEHNQIGTPIGKPLQGIKMHIVEEGTLVEMPRGAIGEITVSGKRVSPAYDGLDLVNHKTKVKDFSGNLFHRMGDLGYQDLQGNFWFCGRLAERIVTKERIFYPDVCERIFLQQSFLERSALIGLTIDGEVQPALIVQIKKHVQLNWEEIVKKLQIAASSSIHTQGIDKFFKIKKMPVDRRHNAKIHRLKLAEKYQ